MNDEIRTYQGSIERRLREMCGILDELPPNLLNFRLDFAGANSAWALATHTLGNARAWVLGIACGREVGRDRESEFASFGTDAATFRNHVEEFIRSMSEALGQLSTDDLERRTLPRRELWGEGLPREISTRDALLQVVEHASLHLGHLHVTRDLALARE